MQEIVVPIALPVVTVDGKDVFNPHLVVHHACRWQVGEISWEMGRAYWEIKCGHGSLKVPLSPETGNETNATIETRPFTHPR